MKLLDRIPVLPLAIITVLFALAPFTTTPHLWQKIQMLLSNTLSRPIDIFDLFMHGIPLLVLLLKFSRILYLKTSHS